MWKQKNDLPDIDNFRYAVRAVRAEYVGGRGWGVRLAPQLWEGGQHPFRTILEEEGFAHRPKGRQYRTLIIDLGRSLGELYEGLHPKWRYDLKRARKNDLEIISGEEETLFDEFAAIYHDMVERKDLDDVTDIDQTRRIQRRLDSGEKLKVFLCKRAGQLCAGAICSVLGDTGVYLHGATSKLGMEVGGSFLVQWAMLEWVKSRECKWYDLNGINPQKNPGVYRFKSRLAGQNGREVVAIGQFDAYPDQAMKLVIRAGDFVRLKVNATRKILSRMSR